LAEEKILIVDPEKLEWQPIKQLPPGAWIKTLRVDKKTGASACLVKFDKGFREPRHAHPSGHDVIVLKGRLLDDEGREILREGMYFYAPARVEHGPVTAPEGCILFVYFDGPAFEE